MPEKWDPYNLSLLDDLLDLITGWVEHYAGKVAEFFERWFGE